MAGAAPSITSTNAGSFEHGKVSLGGPIGYALLFVKYAVPIAALAISIDALRRPVSDFRAPVSRWLWAVPQMVILLVTLTGYLLPLRGVAILAPWVVLMIAIGIPLQIAYLLVVVFPKSRHHPSEE